MFQRLIASRSGPTGSHFERSGAISLLAHLLVVGGAAWATIRPQSAAPAVALVVITWPDEHAPRSAGSDVLPLRAPPEDPGLLSVDVPTGPASVDTRLPFDTASWRASARAVGGVAAPPVGTGDVWTGSQLDDPPTLLAGRAPRYPEMLRVAGVGGRVIVQAVIDTTGRAEPGSVIVVESPNAGFDAPGLAFVRGAVFRPGRVAGRPVRVLIRLPVDFRLGRVQ